MATSCYNSDSWVLYNHEDIKMVHKIFKKQWLESNMDGPHLIWYQKNQNAQGISKMIQKQYGSDFKSLVKIW